MLSTYKQIIEYFNLLPPFWLGKSNMRPFKIILLLRPSEIIGFKVFPWFFGKVIQFLNLKMYDGYHAVYVTFVVVGIQLHRTIFSWMALLFLPLLSTGQGIEKALTSLTDIHSWGESYRRFYTGHYISFCMVCSWYFLYPECHDTNCIYIWYHWN